MNGPSLMGTPPVDSTKSRHVLIFDHSGWCEELNRSYHKGRYETQDDDEFNALSPYASEVLKIDPLEDKPHA